MSNVFEIKKLEKEFKKGDKVKITKFDCSHCEVGDILTLDYIGNYLYAIAKEKDFRGDMQGCSCKINWEKV